MECLTCFNENNFTIRAIDRIGDSMGWHVKFEHQLLDHLKREKLLKRKQNKWHVQNQFAFNWDSSIGGYDFSTKKRIRPVGYEWH
jgi:hypothetical protein